MYLFWIVKILRTVTEVFTVNEIGNGANILFILRTFLTFLRMKNFLSALWFGFRIKQRKRGKIYNCIPMFPVVSPRRCIHIRLTSKKNFEGITFGFAFGILLRFIITLSIASLCTLEIRTRIYWTKCRIRRSKYEKLFRNGQNCINHFGTFSFTIGTRNCSPTRLRNNELCWKSHAF